MKRFLKNNYVWIITPIIAFVIFAFALGIEPIGDRSLVNHDAHQQIFPALCDLQYKLKNGESLNYSWSNGLGGSFLPLFFFYSANPINLFVVFLNTKEILTFLDWFCVARIALASGTFAYVLNKYNEKKIKECKDSEEPDELYNESFYSNRKLIICALALAYSFSGFVCGYYYQMMWLDSYVMFPLVMYGYSQLMNEKKPLLYIISLSISAYLNFYMIYMIAVFLVLYFLLDNYGSLKEFIKKAALFGASSLLSVGISALPLFVCFLGTRNLYVSDDAFPHPGLYGSFLNVFRRFYILSNPVDVSYEMSDANVYCGIFALVLFFVYLSSDTPVLIKVKRLFLVLLLIISMNEKVLNYIWHGFHNQIGVPNRFSFILIYLLLFSAFESFGKIKNVKILIPCLFAIGISPLVLYIFIDFESLFSSSVIIYGTMILVLIYSLLSLIAIKKNKQLCFLLLSFVMIFESSINIFFAFDDNSLDVDSFWSVVEGSENIIKKIENDNKNEKYRSCVYSYSGYLNKGSLYGINGIEGFSSFIGEDVTNFSARFGFFGRQNNVQDMGNCQIVEDILGTRYYYVYNGETIYQNDESLIKIYDDGEYSVLENSDALPIVFAASKEVAKSGGWDQYDTLLNINDLVNRIEPCGDVITEVAPNYSIYSSNCDLAYSDEDYLHLRCVPTLEGERWQMVTTFDIDEDGTYNLYLEALRKCDFSVYRNDKLIAGDETIDYSGIVNIGKLNSGDKISLVLDQLEEADRGFAVEEENQVGIRLARINTEVKDNFIEKTKNGKLELSVCESDHLKGEVEIGGNQILFTTIPYDEGWHAYVDGKEVNIIECADAFIGIDCGQGKHIIELKYIPNGFVPGMIISLCSILALASLAVVVNKGIVNLK